MTTSVTVFLKICDNFCHRVFEDLCIVFRLIMARLIISAHHGLIWLILSRQGSFWHVSARFCSSLLVLAHLSSSRHISARLGTLWLILQHHGFSWLTMTRLFFFFFFFLAPWGYAFPPKGKGGKVLFLFLFGAASIFSA